METVDLWLTDPGQDIKFKQQEPVRMEESTHHNTLIELDERQMFQEMDGFGFTLTGGSAGHLMQMEAASRSRLLQELFGKEKSDIGISFLRISIGASDLNEHVFSYHDVEDGKRDEQMELFDLGEDKELLVPVLKQILAINPEIKIMGSPWSPPAWMKDNRDSRGGSLLPENYEAYAKYLEQYVREMAKEGVPIHSITVQNEPLHPGNDPSLYMPAEQQADFIKNHLGPRFHQEGVDTKIIIYDHNADRPDYPISILNDPEAKKYVDGSAFHLYAGQIEALSEVHEAHPDKNIYFTEQWMGGPGDFEQDFVFHIRELIIGASRNWSKTVLEWNLSSNPEYTPYTERGGCNICLGGVTIDGDQVERNASYFVVAHASKFVRPGSRRIHTNLIEDLPNVAFLTPEGRPVLIVLNEGEEIRDFSIKFQENYLSATLNPKAVATFVW